MIQLGFGFLLPPHGWKDRIIQVDEAFVTPLVATAFLNLLLDTVVPYLVAKIAHRHAMLERALRRKLENVGLTPAIMHRISAKAMFHLLPNNRDHDDDDDEAKISEKIDQQSSEHEKLFHSLHTNANLVIRLMRKRAKIRQDQSKRRKKSNLRFQNVVNDHFKELLKKGGSFVKKSASRTNINVNAVAKMMRGVKHAVKSTEKVVKKVKREGYKAMKTGTGQLKKGLKAVKKTTFGLGRHIHAGISSRRLNVLAEIESTTTATLGAIFSSKYITFFYEYFRFFLLPLSLSLCCLSRLSLSLNNPGIIITHHYHSSSSLIIITHHHHQSSSSSSSMFNSEPKPWSDKVSSQLKNIKERERERERIIIMSTSLSSVIIIIQKA